MAPPREQAIEHALQDLYNRKYPSIHAAAQAYNIHQSALARRFNGGVSKRVARSKQQLLSYEQEDLPVKRILDLE